MSVMFLPFKGGNTIHLFERVVILSNCDYQNGAKSGISIPFQLSFYDSDIGMDGSQSRMYLTPLRCQFSLNLTSQTTENLKLMLDP